MAAMSFTTSHLTPREAQVLQLVARGRSAKEVALELNIAPCTVERHIENVRLKTRTRNRAHMVAVVMSDGWLADLMVKTTLAGEPHGASERSSSAASFSELI